MSETPENSSRRPLVLVFVALLFLLALTIGAARLPLGYLATPVALAIAFAKTFLIVSWFMHLRRAGGLLRVFAAGGLFWLGIAITLTLADYAGR